MKKNLFLAALAFVALASCTSDEFVGENTSPTTSGNVDGAILFESNAPRVTRAEDHATSAATLGYSFNVYATKTTEGPSAETTDDDVTSNVFALNDINGADATAGHEPYQVWYTTSSANKTTSNTYDWEYVGTADDSPYGTGNITLTKDQTIKYWDYSAKRYEFVAYKAKPVSASVEAGTVTKVRNSGFTFTGTAAQFANLYVADKMTITDKANPAAHTTIDNKIGDVVQFTFRSGAAKVRLGFYEIIPGFVVNNLSFRPNGTVSGFTSATTSAKLSGSFNGSSSAASGTYDITYAASVPQIAIFTPASGSTTSGYFDFGTLTYAASTENLGDGIGISSTTPTWAGGSYDYQYVLPNTNTPANMVLYVDYDLYNKVSKETIHVTGAKAVVPQMYMTWNPNYAYTYLFKISDNTNGTTGTEGSSPVGIYPITFDAVTIASTEQEVGTITTVSTPAITTYQEGSVVNNVSESKYGITYAASGKPIYITVNTEGTLEGLTSANTKLYTVNAGTTEADLILNVSTTNKTEVTSGTAVLSVPTSGATAETLQGITFTAGNYAKFTPVAGTTYAVEYLVSAGSAASYSDPITVTVGITDVTGKYERSGSEGSYTYTLTGDTTAQDGKQYCTYTPAVPAVYQYKIIEVAAASGGGSGSR